VSSILVQPNGIVLRDRIRPQEGSAGGNGRGTDPQRRPGGGAPVLVPSLGGRRLFSGDRL